MREELSKRRTRPRKARHNSSIHAKLFKASIDTSFSEYRGVSRRTRSPGDKTSTLAYLQSCGAAAVVRNGSQFAVLPPWRDRRATYRAFQRNARAAMVGGGGVR